jgi:aerobic-type carbon monoxide dehydrogenase small subunit (CoxS/CutS family)
LANEINLFSESIRLHRPRGFYCGIGRCSSCDMTINGVPNVRACVTEVAEGMDVRTQRGRGSVDASR